MWRLPFQHLALAVAIAVAAGPVGAVLDDIRRPVEQVEDAGGNAMLGSAPGIEQISMRLRVEVVSRIGGDRQGGDTGGADRLLLVASWSHRLPRGEATLRASEAPRRTPVNVRHSTARRAPPRLPVFA